MILPSICASSWSVLDDFEGPARARSRLPDQRAGATAGSGGCVFRLAGRRWGGEADVELGALAGRAVQLEPPAERLDAVHEPGQAVAAERRAASAVVADRRSQDAVLQGD